MAPPFSCSPAERLCQEDTLNREVERLMLETIQALDGAFLLWIQDALRTPLLNAFFSAFTQLGNGGVLYIALSVAMLLYPRTRRAGFWALIAMHFGLVCTNLVLKHLVGRARPWLVVEGLRYLVVEGDPLSFPSGHTCAAFAAGVTWARYTGSRWLKTFCVAQAALMGFSRLYVGVHFLTDVLAGCAVGCFCAWLAWKTSVWAEERWGERQT